MRDTTLTPHEYGLRLGAEVRAGMARHKIEGAAMAHLLHCSRNTLYRKIRGEGAFTIPEVVMAADAFNLTAAELLYRVEAPR